MYLPYLIFTVIIRINSIRFVFKFQYLSFRAKSRKYKAWNMMI